MDDVIYENSKAPAIWRSTRPAHVRKTPLPSLNVNRSGTRAKSLLIKPGSPAEDLGLRSCSIPWTSSSHGISARQGEGHEEQRRFFRFDAARLIPGLRERVVVVDVCIFGRSPTARGPILLPAAVSTIVRCSAGRRASSNTTKYRRNGRLEPAVGSLDVAPSST